MIQYKLSCQIDMHLNSITVYPLSPIVTLHCLEAIIERRKSVCSLHYLLEAVLGRLRLPCIAFRGHSIVTPPLQSMKRKLFFPQTGEILNNNSFSRRPFWAILGRFGPFWAILDRFGLTCMAFRGHSIVTPSLQNVKKAILYSNKGNPKEQ